MGLGWVRVFMNSIPCHEFHSSSLLRQLQAGGGGRGLLHGEHSGSALPGASGLKHARDLGAEEVMTPSEASRGLSTSPEANCPAFFLPLSP